MSIEGIRESFPSPSTLLTVALSGLLGGAGRSQYRTG